MPEGMTTFGRQCPFCHKRHYFTVETSKYKRWQQGEDVQSVFPEASTDERETMISGSCGPCFDKAFGGEDE